MTFTIYALRLKGDREVRYVGRTRLGLSSRFYSHVNAAHRLQAVSGLGQWLTSNVGRVEMFELATADSMVEARRIERQMVEAAVKLGQRLFNQWLVPAAHRAELAQAAA